MNKKEIEQIVDQTIDEVLERKRNIAKEVDGWITTSEAAKILGITTTRLLQIKYYFEYRKGGRSLSARVLFKKETLQESYYKFKHHQNDY